MNVSLFFTVSAVMELGAGVALLLAPALAIRVVFGVTDPAAGVAVGRVAGAAVLALGAACWWTRRDGGGAAALALARGMLIYNAAVVALVVSGSLGQPGPLLWGAAALHGAMSVWCLWLMRVTTRTGHTALRGEHDVRPA